MRAAGPLTVPARRPRSQRCIAWLVGRYERAPLTTVACSLAVFCLALAPLTGLLVAGGVGVLVLIHELGHWIGFRRFRIWATAPIFIPLVGGLVITRATAPLRRAHA